MAWRSLTTADVETSLGKPERDALAKVRADDAGDPLPAILASVTDLVRGYIGGAVALGATGLPPQVIQPAVDIAIYQLAKRVHAQSERQRKPPADDAIKLLEGIMDGDSFYLEPDTGTALESESQGAEQAVLTALTFDRTNTVGL